MSTVGTELKVKDGQEFSIVQSFTHTQAWLDDRLVRGVTIAGLGVCLWEQRRSSTVSCLVCLIGSYAHFPWCDLMHPDKYKFIFFYSKNKSFFSLCQRDGAV